MKKNADNVNYFRIGLFILIGILLIIISIVIFGSKTLFKDYVYAETYFDESVQGLSKGSPVKYLGMEVGHVADIATVDSIYKRDQNGSALAPIGGYIYVKMIIFSRFFNVTDKSILSEKIQKAVSHGLRIKLSSQGLTGTAYLELDFVGSPKADTQLPITWQPTDYYIPSVPSTLTYFSDNAHYILGELRKVDIPKTFNAIQQLTATTSQTVANTNKLLEATHRQLVDMLASLQEITQNMASLSEQAKLHPSSLLFSQPPQKLDLNKL